MTGWPAAPGAPQAAPDAATLIAQAGRCRQADDLAQAESLLRRAVQQAPALVAALTNHGLVLAELGRLPEALGPLRQAVALAPDFAPAWTNLALALRLGGRADEADEAQRRATQLDPQSAVAQVARGLSAQSAGRVFEAIEAYRAALRVDAALPEAWINLALALNETGDVQGCRQALEQALRLKPGDRRALANLLMTSQYHPALTAADLRSLAARAGQAWPSRVPRPAPRPANAGPLRVGYLSGDLYAHPVGWLLGPVLRAHDPAWVDVHVFDHRPAHGEPDAVTLGLQAAVPHWHAVAGLDDGQLAGRIADAGIDVLVDLSGHTQGSRLGVLALRPAPVQLSWLGYFGSTGLPAVDAVILGSSLAPAGAEAAYTEAIERVDGVHFAYDPPPWAPLPGPAPSVLRGAITFGCFNNPAKMGDAVVQCWASLLLQVPGSRLVLKWKTFADPGFMHLTRQRFAAHGVAPERLDLRPASPHPQMLAEYGDIDVALDPFPFAGLTSTLEALWMGVPVVTLPTPRSVSRQSLAVLSAIDLAGWAADTPRQYIARAAALAADLPGRQALRGSGAQGLRQRLEGSPLLKATALADQLTAIYRRRLNALRTSPGP